VSSWGNEAAQVQESSHQGTKACDISMGITFVPIQLTKASRSESNSMAESPSYNVKSEKLTPVRVSLSTPKE
jgi:hypothetical protein